MKIALFGGTHGNEPVGLEVMNLFKKSKKKYKNSFETFWGNPKAFELKKRYVDTDLNRAFGKNGIRKGYEQERAKELEALIANKFDFSIDLHTTTSNMGQTIILNNTHAKSRKLAAYIQKSIPGFLTIEEVVLDSESNHLNRLCPAGVTVELGPIANNVIEADLVFKMHHIVEHILDFDFSQEIDLKNFEYYKMLGQVNYPDEEGWYIHPSVDRHDFKELKTGADMFVNIKGETKKYEGKESIYPFFVNEAAYLENKSAFLLAKKNQGL